MAAVAERPRRAKAPPAVRRLKPPTDGWWGDGTPPHERWPGVTIKIPAQWVPLPDGTRKVRVRDEDDPGLKRDAYLLPDGTEIPGWWGRGGGRWESPDGRYYYDQEEADKAVEFFPTYLQHHIGEFAGDAFSLLPYQEFLLTRPIFGWRRPGDGLRRFRKVFGFLAKGAGKSPWGAGTGLYMTLCDREPAAETYAVAGDKQQARTVFDNSKVMVEESPVLNEMCEVLKDSIYHAESRSRYLVISSDASTKHGFRPHCVIFDEFHAQKNRDLYEALKKSMVKRRHPLMVLISHAGDDDEGICYEEYELAKRVLSGSIPDDAYLPVIFEASSEDDWTDPELWPRVNPGHGITVKHEAITSECMEAIAEPRKRNDFLRFHLNRWTNQATAWIPVEWWDACESTLHEPELVGLQCASGLDLAQKWDLAAFDVVFRQMLPQAETVEIVANPVEEGGEALKKTIELNFRLVVLSFFWIPEDTMKEHEKKDGVPYSLWAQQEVLPGLKLLTPTDGTVIDNTRIYADITKRILPRFPLLKQGPLAYDPAFATDIALQLRDRAHMKVLEVGQSFNQLSEPSQIVEALIKGKRLRHDGNRLMRSHVENAAVKTDDAGRIKPVKPKKNSTKRIDGMLAAVLGTKALLTVPQKRSSNVLVV